ncbi:MAG: cation diffusion facilitator family transporter, partial [Hyphomicrobiales bacterium]
MAHESKSTVLAAMAANFGIAAGKLVAGILTGSAALLAEAGHSVADTVNQVFLLIGINLSTNEPDERHPHGYGKDAFFWSFLAAVFIFVAGAVFSLFEGIRTLVQEVNHHRSQFELLIAYGVLAISILFEGTSFVIAVRQVRRAAARIGWSSWKYIRRSPDLTVKTVVYEDSAALAGLLLAAIGLTLSELFHTEAWDGAASIAIGILLAFVAVMLGAQSRELLLGKSVTPETREEILETIASFDEIEDTVRLLTMLVGPNSILVNGELQVRRNMTTSEIEDLIRRLDDALVDRIPDVADTFWELRHRAA